LILIILSVTVIFIPKVSRKFYTQEVENKLEGIAFSIEYYLLNEAKNGEIDFDFIARIMPQSTTKIPPFRVRV